MRQEMKRLLSLVLLCGCHTAPLADKHAVDAGQVRESAHFRVEWRAPESSEAEASAVLTRAEQGWVKIVPILGVERAPTERLTVRLAGDSTKHEIPTVDPSTRNVLLYRMQGPGGDYPASLVHELVHAFRWPVWTKPQLQTDSLVYLEEALAELVAVEAGFLAGLSHVRDSPSRCGGCMARLARRPAH